jgi:Holliday junction DNA helicase RuvB
LTIKRFSSQKKEPELVLNPQNATETDANLDNSLRPKTLDEYVGQAEIKTNLDYLIKSSKLRQEPLDHVLLYGPPGLGKTTLANIIGSEVGASVRITSGPALEKQGDIASIITNLKENDILFIDEIHRLKPAIEEILYSAMEDFAIDLVIGKGPAAKTMRLKLPRFTLVGATTKVSMLSSPLRDRFGAIYKLQFYSQQEINEIIQRSAAKLNVNVETDASELLARSSRQTPRIANRLLKRTRDFALVNGQTGINKKSVKECLNLLGVDELGLEEADRIILSTIIEKFRGGPVGLGSIAAATSDDEGTIEDVYEPFLLQLGMLERTNRGRTATEKAYRHLGFKI